MSTDVAVVAEKDLAEVVAALPAAEPHADPIALTMIATPLGPMIGAAISEGLCLLEFFDRRAFRTELKDLVRLLGRPVVATDSVPARAHLEAVREELGAYFDGRLMEFKVPLVTPGTAFERQVWAGLLKIPFGRTCSYGQLAAVIGNPDASRAVGRANGRNRIAIAVPCHRVIESTGALRGYGGGLERKRFLLDLERRAAGGDASLFG